MIDDSPFDCLHGALAAAVHVDLPDVAFTRKDYSGVPKKGPRPKYDDIPTVQDARRPMAREVSVTMFLQTWGSTALGYGGIGGAAMTTTYTVVAVRDAVACVYFGPGGHLAYRVDLRQSGVAGRQRFQDDMHKFEMAHVGDEDRYA